MKNNYIISKNKKIENNVFAECTGLTKLDIKGESVSLGYSTFKNSTSLSNLRIPISVKTTKSSILSCSEFAGCTNIKDIYLYKGAGVGTHYSRCTGSSEGFYCYDLNTQWYYSKDNNITVTFEEGITSIGRNMFYNCFRLNKVIFKSHIFIKIN